MGHLVTVLTALPSYPKGEIYPAYRGRFIVIEDDESGVHIVRTWIYATKETGFVTRIIGYLSFALLSVVVGWRLVDDADIVLVESPPSLRLFGLFNKPSKAREIHSQCFRSWPESAVVLGVLRSNFLIRFATKAEEWLYRRAIMVTGQTQGIVRSVRERCTTPVHLLTNGVAPEFIDQVERARKVRAQLRQQFRFGDEFIVGYMGLHGLAEGLGTILQSAELLVEQTAIRFCFFGDGPEKTQLQSASSQKKIENVDFSPPVPADQMAELLAAVDVSIVPTEAKRSLQRGAPFQAL